MAMSSAVRDTSTFSKLAPLRVFSTSPNHWSRVACGKPASMAGSVIAGSSWKGPGSHAKPVCHAFFGGATREKWPRRPSVLDMRRQRLGVRDPAGDDLLARQEIHDGPAL